MINSKIKVMVTNEIKSNRVVLQLLGIDKKWVRSPEGIWVDKKTMKKIKKTVAFVEESTENKKWWKFWRQ